MRRRIKGSILLFMGKSHYESRGARYEALHTGSYDVIGLI